MRVVGVTEFGGADALGVHELPDPHPGPGEVRIKVHAAAVSPTDTHVRAGTYGPVSELPPYIPGMDAAGVVEEVGEGSPWEVGDELMAFALPTGPNRGAYVESLVGPWQSMSRAPKGVSLVEASTLPMNGLTALQALEKLSLAPGATLAVTGAAGTLGSYVVALAKRDGITVVTDAAQRDHPWLESIGADYVLPRGDEFVSAVRDVYPEGVDAVVDAAVLNDAIVPVLRRGGQLATVRFWEGPAGGKVVTHVVRVRDEYYSNEKLDFLRERVEDGTLRLRVAGTLPADQASEAHRRLEEGGLRGRLVLTW